jgi:hypothetical protein
VEKCWYCVEMKNNRFNGKDSVAFSALQKATDLQYAILAQQLPSMNKRMDAYTNTRDIYYKGIARC